MLETSFGGDVRERPVTIVVVERVAVNASDKQVGPAVIVVVGDGHGDVKARARETGFFRHVCKHAVAVVAVKTVRELRGILFESLDIGAVGEEDIGTAILVVVKNRHATGHGGGSVRVLQGLVGLDAEGQGCEREFDLGRGGSGGCGREILFLEGGGGGGAGRSGIPNRKGEKRRTTSREKRTNSV